MEAMVYKGCCSASRRTWRRTRPSSRQLLKDANELRDKAEEIRKKKASRRLVAYVRDFRKSLQQFGSGRRTGCPTALFFSFLLQPPRRIPESPPVWQTSSTAFISAKEQTV